jgi:predicted transcriptional regulator
MWATILFRTTTTGTVNDRSMARNGSPTPLDDCLRVLGHERRREVIVALVDATPLRTDTLAEDERRKLALIHNHLPVLADSGYVDWDRETGRIRRGPRFDEADALLELLRTHEDDLPWTVV